MNTRVRQAVDGFSNENSHHTVQRCLSTIVQLFFFWLEVVILDIWPVT